MKQQLSRVQPSGLFPRIPFSPDWVKCSQLLIVKIYQKSAKIQGKIVKLLLKLTPLAFLKAFSPLRASLIWVRSLDRAKKRTAAFLEGIEWDPDAGPSRFL